MPLTRWLALSVLAGSLYTPWATADSYDAVLTRAIAAKESALDVNEPARWLEALRLFQQADAIRSSGETKYELAYAAAQLKQYDLAVEAYEAAIDLGLGEAALARANALVSEYLPSMGRLRLTGPAGTEIYVAQVLRGRLPLAKPLVLFSGDVELEIRSSGASRTQRVQIARGSTHDLALVAPAPAPAAPAPTPSRPTPPERDATAIDSVETPSASVVPWILIAAGGTLAAAGAVTIPVSFDRIDSARAELREVCAVPDGIDGCQNPEPGQREAAQAEVDRIATWKAWRVGGIVTAGVGTLALASGIVMLLSQPSGRQTAQLGVGPVVGGDGLSLSVNGSF